MDFLKSKFVQIWFGCFSLPLFGFATLHTIESTDQLPQNIPTDALVFVDLNNTLIRPEQPMLGKPEGREFFLQKTQYLDQPTQERLQTLLNAKTQWILIEEGFRSWIQSMQQNKIAVLGITGYGNSFPFIGKLAYHPQLFSTATFPKSVEAYLLQVLNQLQIDFQNPWFENFAWKQFALRTRSSLQQGVLFLRNQLMGDVIPLLFDFFPSHFSQVIAIDDEISYLRELEAQLAAKKIPFDGYYYVGASRFDKTYDEEVAKQELETFLQTEASQEVNR